MQVTNQSAIPTCQTFLDGLMAGKCGGDQDTVVLEAIAHAILVRGDRPEIHLKHKNGQVREHARLLPLHKALVRKSRLSKSLAAFLRVHATARR